MFLPKIFKSEDRKILQRIISENAFATLISSKVRLQSSHAMFLINGDAEGDFHLETHLSRANPQAKILADGDEVLCDFLGAHSYISSGWYAQENVSTWNYEAVQIYGKVQLMDDGELLSHLTNLTLKYEIAEKCPFLVENMRQDFVEKEMKGAFGIKIFPTEIFIKQKLSQNRDDTDFKNIIAKLSTKNDENSVKIAHLMRETRP